MSVKSNTEKISTGEAQNGTKKSQVGKYITQMRELPPEADEEEAKSPPKPQVKESSDLKPAEKPIQKEEKKPEIKTESDEDPAKDNSKLPLSSKDIILGIINLVSIIFLIIILTKFPKKASELKQLRNDSLMTASTTASGFTEIEDSKVKAEELNKLFLDESGVVNFVNEIEKIKARGGSSIVKPTFTSQKAVKDRTGNFGVPIVIEMKGNWETISRDIQEIDKLPFLYRPANTDVRPDEEDSSVIHFKYGVLLYVIDRLGQER